MSKTYLHQGAITEAQIGEVLLTDVEGGTIGGQAVFLGRVRADSIEGKIVEAIEYSAYAEMVDVEFMKIEQHFLETYPDVQKITMLHAVGLVPVGQTALLVVVSGGHRKDAFKVLPAVVDEIKAKIPIWKKEILGDGSYKWTQN